MFFAGQIVSLVGTFLTQVAIVWLVYTKSGSGRVLGFTAFAGQIPSFVLGPFAGVWVERMERRRLLVWTQIGGAVLLPVLVPDRWSSRRSGMNVLPRSLGAAVPGVLRTITASPGPGARIVEET